MLFIKINLPSAYQSYQNKKGLVPTTALTLYSLVARGGLATKTPKSLIYIGANRKIATNRCSTCLEHLMPYFDVNFSQMLALKNW